MDPLNSNACNNTGENLEKIFFTKKGVQNFLFFSIFYSTNNF